MMSHFHVLSILPPSVTLSKTFAALPYLAFLQDLDLVASLPVRIELELLMHHAHVLVAVQLALLLLLGPARVRYLARLIRRLALYLALVLLQTILSIPLSTIP